MSSLYRCYIIRTPAPLAGCNLQARYKSSVPAGLFGNARIAFFFFNFSMHISYMLVAVSEGTVHEKNML